MAQPLSAAVEFFELQKIVTAFVGPLGFAMLLMLLGVALSRRWIVLLAVAWLWLWATPWAAHRLADVVQAPVTLRPAVDLPTADVIVVLGGALSPSIPRWNPEINLTSAGDRVLLAARLYQLGKAPRILFTGGPVNYFGDSEASASVELFERLGVPREAVLTEVNSRTTRENASFSLPLLQKLSAQRVLLVSSAAHLPRSLRNFEDAARALGVSIEFIPAPCDPVEIFDNVSPVKRWLPSTEALNINQILFRQLLGLLWARVGGD